MRAPMGAFFVDAEATGGTGAPPRLRPPDRPAAVMVLAPALGLAVWLGIFALLL